MKNSSYFSILITISTLWHLNVFAAECLNLEKTTIDIFEKPNYYQFVHDINISGGDVSQNFENQMVKKFFKSQELVKSEKSKLITKYEQKDCSEVLARTPDGNEIHYSIIEKSINKLVLRPKADVLETHTPDENIEVERIVFKQRRISGYKAIEKIIYLKFKLTNESHLVEIHSTISWNKPLQLKRLISEKFLKILAQLVVTQLSPASKQIAKDEQSSPTRSISSVRNYDRFLDL